MTPTEMMPSSVFAVIFHGIVKVGLAFDIPSLGFGEKKCVLQMADVIGDGKVAGLDTKRNYLSKF